MIRRVGPLGPPAIPAYQEVLVGLYSPCVKEDLAVIRDILTERGAAPSLDNAQAVLAVGLRNKPEAWTVTAAELPELWEGMTGDDRGRI